MNPHKLCGSRGQVQELGVVVDVRDHLGRPAAAEIALYSANEGVLSLIGYKTPDPVPVFTAARPLGVATLESRDALARLTLRDLALGVDKGTAGGGGGEGPARADFRQTAYFNPSVIADVTGTARVRFKLPESLTTWRLMAIAVDTGDRYGFAAERVTTSRRLMARPALPRVLRAGDRIDAGVVVSSKGFGPASVRVRAHVEGLDVEGPTERVIELGRDGSREVRFSLSAPRVGQAAGWALAQHAGNRIFFAGARRLPARPRG